ncbi:MAG: hypothetical protein ACTSPO_15950 [Candidatus Heimdallarchaeaceae archaeon]
MKSNVKRKLLLSFLLFSITLISVSFQQISVIGGSVTYQGYVKEVDGDPIVSATVGLYSGGLIA